MDEVPVFTFVEYNFTLMAILLVVKIVFFFFLRLKKPTFKNFLFFSDSNLHGTKDLNRKKMKSFQNLLSVILFFLLLMQVIVFFGGALIKPKLPDLH